MVCREAQVGSAVTSYVIQSTNLEEQQVLSLYHEVMRDGRAASAPTALQQLRVIDSIAQAVQANSALTDARRRSIIGRLERARNEDMNGQRYYSTSRLMERAQRAEEALNTYVSDAARDLGVTENEVRSRLANLRASAGEDRTLAPSRGWVAAVRNDADYSGMPLDRQTAYAVETINAERLTRVAAQPSRPAVRRETIDHSRAIREMGYDPETGRVEVVLRTNPDVVYAYRMSPAEYNNFRSSDSVGSYYATHVRGNDHYRYATSEASDAAATVTQCPTCGQFEGAGHACPPRDSAEERNRTVRRARQAVRRPAATPAAEPAPESAEPIRLRGRHRRYFGASGGFNTVNLSEVQQTCRRNRSGVNLPVSALITRVAGEDGAVVVGRGSVSGTMQVTYNGRGRGYTAVAVTSPGDSGRDQLRCNCADYQRNYDCVHVRQAVQDLNTRLNQDALRTQHAIGPAIEQVNADLAQDRAESIEAQATSRSTWGESPVSYTDDHAAFQRDYKAAKDRVAAGQPAVPYMTENATDGLGARGTGRGFGIELEFDIDSGVDRATALRNIGVALHRAGLTRTARQTGYHSAERNGYTENHQGGWSYEADCTVSGEIVSPIMYDTPETWENIAKVCEIVKANGGTVTTRTGSHVHVSAHNYDHTVENHNRLLGAFAENEDVIYRLSSNPDRGTHRGPQWCAPNRVPASGYSSVTDARARNHSHGLGLNMQSVHGRQSDHVEFRTYDASLEPAVIQTQIKLSLAVTESAFRDTTYQPGSHTPLGSHRSHNRAAFGQSRRLTGEAWQQDTAGYRTFADRLFRRPEDKAQLTALFAVTKWQRGARR